MNRRAFELPISTLVVIILGILVLIGLALFLSGGFKNLKSSTEPFLDTTQSTSIKQACSLACSNEDKLTFCCREYEIDEMKIKCGDERLELDCGLDCSAYACTGQTITSAECESLGGIVVSDMGDGSIIFNKRCPNEKTYMGFVPGGDEGSICCK